MSKTFGKSLSLGVGVLAMVACNPYPSSPGVKLTTSAPPTKTVTVIGHSGDPEDVQRYELDFVASAEITGEAFTLGDGDCDPRQFTVAESGALIPGWDPYACSQASGEPIEGQGNIQYFVDGIFMGYHIDTDLEVNLAPKLDGSDIRMAYYVDELGGTDWKDDEFDTDDDGVIDLVVPVDANGNGTTDAIVGCYFYYPQDNLGYAKAQYEAVMNLEDYKARAVYGLDLLDEYGNLVQEAEVYDTDGTTALSMNEQVPDGFIGSAYYGAWPWTTFEYFGANVDEAIVEGYADFDPNLDGSHVFYAELHYDNHAPVYGAGRIRHAPLQLDVDSMPADWCGHFFGVGNPGFLY